MLTALTFSKDWSEGNLTEKDYMAHVTRGSISSVLFYKLTKD